MNDAASVLIVDDEPSIRLMFRTALSRRVTRLTRPATVQRPLNDLMSRHPM